jgi:hypothetical protein
VSIFGVVLGELLDSLESLASSCAIIKARGDRDASVAGGVAVAEKLGDASKRVQGNRLDDATMTWGDLHALTAAALRELLEYLEEDQ